LNKNNHHNLKLKENNFFKWIAKLKILVKNLNYFIFRLGATVVVVVVVVVVGSVYTFGMF